MEDEELKRTNELNLQVRSRHDSNIRLVSSNRQDRQLDDQDSGGGTQ